MFLAAASQAAAQGGDWTTYGGNDWNQRYSALKTINTSNVSQLVPRMMFQTGIAKLGSFENTPIVTVVLRITIMDLPCMGRAKAHGLLEALRDTVDRNDGARAGEARALYHVQTHAAAAEHGHRGAGGDGGHVDDGPHAGHDGAAENARDVDGEIRRQRGLPPPHAPRSAGRRCPGEKSAPPACPAQRVPQA